MPRTHASDSEKSKSRRSPLAGWLGKRTAPAEIDPLPEIDLAGGLNRALRRTASVDAKPAGSQGDEALRTALGAIEAALYAIDGIRDTLEQASEVVMSATLTEDVAARALLADRYDEFRLSIDAALGELDPRAAVLLGAQRRHLDVAIAGRARYSVSPTQLDSSADGLNLTPPRNAFSDGDEAQATLDEIDRALSKADRTAAGYCRDAQYLIERAGAA